MKKLIVLFSMLISIVACKKDGSDNDVEPSSSEGNYLTLNDGVNNYSLSDDNPDHSMSCGISKIGISSCEVRAEIIGVMRLYISGENSESGLEGQYSYKRDTTQAHGGRTYLYHDKTTEDPTTADDGIVWWADSTVINITYARFDSVNAFSNRLIAKGNYKVWLNYRNTETKVVSGEFNIE